MGGTTGIQGRRTSRKIQETYTSPSNDSSVEQIWVKPKGELTNELMCLSLEY